MLGVTFTSGAVLDEGEKRKQSKKEKKRKKDKRIKKEKQEKRGAGKSSDDSASEDGDGPVHRLDKLLSDNQAAAGRETDTGDVPAVEAKPQLNREDWMIRPMKREPATATQKDDERHRQEEEEAERKQAAEPEIVAGLRIMKKPDPATGGLDASGAPGPGAGALTGGSAAAGVVGRGPGGGGGLVGDGGASWRLKALRRAQEQARAEGRSLQEVVGERWGSLAHLTEGLTATLAADGKAHLRAAAERRRAAVDGAPPVVPHYLQDVRSDRAKMIRPSEDASLSWRRDRDRDRARDCDGEPRGPNGADRVSRGSNSASRSREGDPVSERKREREPSRRPEDGSRGEEERETHSSRQERDERSRGQADGRDSRPHEGRCGAGDPGGEDRGMPVDSERDHGRDRDRDRGREGDRDRDQRRERSGERDRGRHRERPDHGRDCTRLEHRAAPGFSGEQATALQQVAGALNAFDDDGSFMERFMALRRGGGQHRNTPAAAAQELAAASEPSEAGSDLDRGDVDRGPLSGAEGGRPGANGLGPSSASGGAGSANRGVAAMLRARAAGGAGAGGTGVRQDGEEDRIEPTAAASRRAPLVVGGRDDGGQAAAAGDDGGGGAGGGGGMGNKSAAELLRARLKGLPPPPSVAAGSLAAASGGGPALKTEADVGDATAGTRGGRRGSDDGAAGDGGSGGGGGGGGRSRREVVQLPLVDAHGRAVRGAFGREAAGAGVAPNAGRRAGTKPPERYNRQTGQKERYFVDDDKVDLQTMLRRAKYGDDDMDMDQHLAANIAKKKRFRGTELDVDGEYDYDGGLEMYESRCKRGSAEAQRARDRSRQVSDLRRQQAAEAGCSLCLSNPSRPRHLTISLGTCAYLSLPARGRLVRGHCCIAPADHCPSIRGLHEAAWTEVKNFIKCLIRMYGAQGQSVLFMETYMTRSGGRHHAVLEAVPVTERQLEKARGYFKKAILEAESEWSTHHAKACIETSAQKGLRESIPPNFPYFYVQFGYGSGYVHVIDDETKFDANFGRQVLIGLLDLPPEMAYQRHKAESVATQQQWAREFESQWDLYDWTRQLHDGA